MLGLIIRSIGTWNPKKPEIFIVLKSILKRAGYDSDSIDNEWSSEISPVEKGVEYSKILLTNDSELLILWVTLSKANNALSGGLLLALLVYYK